jgi:hypothetical protein
MPFEYFNRSNERKASMHGLIILASAKLVTTFKRLPLSTSIEICDVLRNPGLGMLYSLLAFRQLKILDDDDDVSVNIRRSIIPAIHNLQRRLSNESLSAVLGSDVVRSQLSLEQLDPSFLCMDLRQSDIFFNSLKKK